MNVILEIQAQNC